MIWKLAAEICQAKKAVAGKNELINFITVEATMHHRWKKLMMFHRRASVRETTK